MSEEQIQMWMDQGIELAGSFVPKVLAVIFIFIVGRWLAGRFSKLAVGAMTRAKVDGTLTAFASNMVRYVILTVAVLAALGQFGVETGEVS